MDFEEYWRNGCFGEYHDIYAKNLAEQFYKAGQQSKQVEIDAIIKWVEENKKSIPLSEWHGYITEEYVDADDLLELLK